MGAAKKFIKGLATGAVLAAVATLVVGMRDEKNRHLAKELGRAGHDIKERMAKHAKKFGKLTKAAYGKIVDTTVAEYRGVKALSESDLDDLKGELKAGWTDIQSILKSRRPPCPPAKKGKKA